MIDLDGPRFYFKNQEQKQTEIRSSTESSISKTLNTKAIYSYLRLVFANNTLCTSFYVFYYLNVCDMIDV